MIGLLVIVFILAMYWISSFIELRHGKTEQEDQDAYAKYLEAKELNTFFDTCQVKKDTRLHVVPRDCGCDSFKKE